MEIAKVLVIGAGTMGRQIAMSSALAGYETVLQDVSDDALQAARADLESWAASRVAKGRLEDSAARQALRRLAQESSLEAAAADVDLVIEAAVERLEVKRAIFERLRELVPPHSILTTNSSTLASSHIAEASGRPDRVANMHFFNPALVMQCVEIVRNPQTSDETVESVMAFARTLGKDPVLVRKEVPGFIANRMMGAIQREAMDLAAAGVASIEDIDTTARTALGHPMGPFELMDLVGLDVIDFIAQATFAETRDEADRPHLLVTAKVVDGKLGRKSGEGFYQYGK